MVALVAAITWVLRLVQSYMIAIEGAYVHPFGIVYVVAVALLTMLAGYVAGIFTLALSLMATLCFLMPSHPLFHIDHPSDLVELVFDVLVNALVIVGAEAMRRNVSLVRANREVVAREKGALAREQHALLAQKAFFKDVLLSVTDNHFYLCDSHAELPACVTIIHGPRELAADRLADLRQLACQAAREQGFSDERCYDLMTAVSEAAMNAIVHAKDGKWTICLGEQEAMQVRIQDAGGGIPMDHLPKATLERGHSTAGTLGHGFWMILQTIDRLWLLTGPTGTTVVLEMDKDPPSPKWMGEA